MNRISIFLLNNMSSPPQRPRDGAVVAVRLARFCASEDVMLMDTVSN